jgi:hypothetical protein
MASECMISSTELIQKKFDRQIVNRIVVHLGNILILKASISSGADRTAQPNKNSLFHDATIQVQTKTIAQI